MKKGWLACCQLKFLKPCLYLFSLDDTELNDDSLGTAIPGGTRLAITMPSTLLSTSPAERTKDISRRWASSNPIQHIIVALAENSYKYNTLSTSTNSINAVSIWISSQSLDRYTFVLMLNSSSSAKCFRRCSWMDNSNWFNVIFSSLFSVCSPRNLLSWYKCINNMTKIPDNTKCFLPWQHFEAVHWSVLASLKLIRWSIWPLFLQHADAGLLQVAYHAYVAGVLRAVVLIIGFCTAIVPPSAGVAGVKVLVRHEKGFSIIFTSSIGSI